MEIVPAQERPRMQLPSHRGRQPPTQRSSPRIECWARPGIEESTPARARCSHGNLGSLRWGDPDGSFMEPLERFFLMMALAGIVGMVATVAVAMFVGQ